MARTGKKRPKSDEPLRPETDQDTSPEQGLDQGPEPGFDSGDAAPQPLDAATGPETGAPHDEPRPETDSARTPEAEGEATGIVPGGTVTEDEVDPLAQDAGVADPAGPDLDPRDPVSRDGAASEPPAVEIPASTPGALDVDPDRDRAADPRTADAPETDRPEDGAPPDLSPMPEPPEPAALFPAGGEAAQDPAPAPVRVQKVGFLPLLIGGIVAAAFGFAAAWFAIPREDTALAETIAAQDARIDDLEAQIAALPPPPDLAPLEEGAVATEGEIRTLREDLAQRIDALDARLTELERMPNADGTLADTAIAAYERELEALREDVAAQQERMQALVDEASARLDAARQEAVDLEQRAAASAAAATARAALDRVLAALESGAPFADALADLSIEGGVAVPVSLTAAAAEGVPTMAELRDSFPPAAREALAVARRLGLTDEEGGRVAAFLRNQLDLRSVTPQEGTGPDAVLSRAEEALRQNRLAEALEELEALPEPSRAAMSDWIDAAQTRAAALDAVDGLGQSLNEN